MVAAGSERCAATSTICTSPPNRGECSQGCENKSECSFHRFGPLFNSGLGSVLEKIDLFGEGGLHQNAFAASAMKFRWDSDPKTIGSRE